MYLEKEMEEEEISYKTLRKIQQMEKNSPVLTFIKSEFYSDLSEFFKNLDTRLENEKDSQKKMLLEEEIQNTKKIAVNIYEQREKKIILASISKARGGEPDLKNMVEIEKNLFDSVLGLMIDARKKFLDEKKDNNNLKKETTDKNKIETELKEKEQTKQNINPIIRVNQDIPEFIGTDEKRYNLRKNDIISVPEEMSEMLSKKGVVERVKS